MILKELARLIAIFAVLAQTGSVASYAEEKPFEYAAGQVIYIEPNEPTFYEQYAIKGPLDQLAMEYDFELRSQKLSLEVLAAEENKIRAQIEADAREFEQYQIEADNAIALLWPHVGVTPYGYGFDPQIWDCSGLTMWYLQNRGIEVIHSATAQVQDYRSTIVNEPVPGDLVAFRYPSARSYFHIGVYVGGGYMIHASNPDKGTNLQLVSEFASIERSNVIYVRY